VRLFELASLLGSAQGGDGRWTRRGQDVDVEGAWRRNGLPTLPGEGQDTVTLPGEGHCKIGISPQHLQDTVMLPGEGQ
jgi:hypothetical protein